jgi:hypothetical protein
VISRRFIAVIVNATPMPKASIALFGCIFLTTWSSTLLLQREGVIPQIIAQEKNQNAQRSRKMARSI